MEAIKPISDEALAEVDRFLSFGGAMLKVKSSAVSGLIARLRQAEKDAERYRWLRNKGFSFVNDEAGQGISMMRWGEFATDTTEDLAHHIDAAIDAAMQGHSK